MRNKLLFVGLLSVGMVGFVPATHAADRASRAAEQKDEPSGQHLEFSDLPKPVQRGFEKHGKDYNSFMKYKGTDQTWYVGVLANGKKVHLDTRGQVIDEPKLLSNRSEGNDRTARTERKTDDNRADMRWEDLPGNIKEVVGKQTRQGEKVIAVWKVREKGQNYYHVRIQGENERARVMRVADDGTFEIDRNGTTEGNLTVDYSDLPGPTKETISKESNGHTPKTVRQVTRDRKTWYVANVGDRTIYVDDNGNVLREK